MSQMIQRQQIGLYTVIEFMTPSLMDPVLLQELSKQLYHIVQAEDRRQIVLDFEKVQYVSSQAIGIVMGMHQLLKKLSGSKLILCSVGAKLMELIKIIKLDRVLTIKPSQREATAN